MCQLIELIEFDKPRVPRNKALYSRFTRAARFLHVYGKVNGERQLVAVN